MILFSPIQRISENYLCIPRYIRSCLGWHNGINLHLSLLKESTYDFRSEIIISPIPITDRSDIWTLRASFRNRTDLLLKLSTLIRDLNINIIDCSSFTLENGRYVNIELLLDCQLYKSKFDGDTAERTFTPKSKLKTLEAKIGAEFIEEILFYHDGKPYVETNRNLQLFRSQKYVAVRDQKILNKSMVRICSEALAKIKEQFITKDRDFSEKRNKINSPLAVIIGDLDSYLIRTYVFFENSGFAHARFQIENRIGALSAISSALKSRNLRILQTNTRILNTGSTALVDFLLNLIPEKDSEKDDSKLKSYIKSIEKESGLEDYALNISFPGQLSSANI